MPLVTLNPARSPSVEADQQTKLNSLDALAEGQRGRLEREGIVVNRSEFQSADRRKPATTAPSWLHLGFLGLAVLASVACVPLAQYTAQPQSLRKPDADRCELVDAWTDSHQPLRMGLVHEGMPSGGGAALMLDPCRDVVHLDRRSVDQLLRARVELEVLGPDVRPAP